MPELRDYNNPLPEQQPLPPEPTPVEVPASELERVVSALRREHWIHIDTTYLDKLLTKGVVTGGETYRALARMKQEGQSEYQYFERLYDEREKNALPNDPHDILPTQVHGLVELVGVYKPLPRRKEAIREVHNEIIARKKMLRQTQQQEEPFMDAIDARADLTEEEKARLKMPHAKKIAEQDEKLISAQNIEDDAIFERSYQKRLLTEGGWKPDPSEPAKSKFDPPNIRNI